MPTQSWKEIAAQTIIKQGPWAIVATALLIFFGWHLHNFAETAGVAITDYVVQSRKNLDTLTEIVKNVAEAAEDNRQSNAQNALLIKQNSEQNDAIMRSLERAFTMMEPSYKIREEQIKVLNEIKDLLEKN